MAVIHRRETAVVDVGGIQVGGSHPIVVQSMTNTDTADVTSTVNQVMALASAGSELVRVTVNTEQAAAAIPRIADCLQKFGDQLLAEFSSDEIVDDQVTKRPRRLELAAQSFGTLLDVGLNQSQDSHLNILAEAGGGCGTRCAATALAPRSSSRER